MSKRNKARLYFLVGLFGPSISIAFLPWWLSAPLCVLLFMILISGFLQLRAIGIELQSKKNSGVN